MVLFLCILVGVATLLACVLWRIAVRFHIQLTGAHFYAHADLCLLFGLIRIPMGVETSIPALLRRTEKKKPKARKPQRKRLLHTILWHGRKTGALRLKKFKCCGRIGDADDAFCSVMAAGVAEIVLELLRAWFPAHSGSISIAPSFEHSVVWVYLEGILEIVPTQIIGVLIRDEKTRRNRA